LVSDRRWKQLVREGKALVLEGAKNRLRLGELSEEIEPLAGRGGDRRSADFKAGVPALNAYAEEIDTTVDLLEECRLVWNRWDGKAPGVSWSNLRELGREDNPPAAYAAVKKAYGKVTILTVREWRGKKTAGVRSTSSVSERTRAAKQLLADPDVINELAQDEEGMAAVHAVERQNREYGDIAGLEVDEHLKPIRRAMGRMVENVDPVMSMFAELVKRMTEITRDDIDIDPEDWSMIRHHWKKVTEELEVYALRHSLPSVTSGVK
jgi:hypothetical protein